MTAATLTGCRPIGKALGGKNGTSGANGTEAEVPTDKMTFRTNPHTGDRVSLLGYGCMRWPLRKNSDGEDEIDQEKVNELVDYALAHGVNYFDTAPVYIRGWSETATGIALARHPRDSYFIATKASNHRGPYELSECIAMYRRSMTNLQVDYLDYYLLHSVGASIENFRQRYVDNGFLDFLLAERAAGRIRNLGWSFHGVREVFDYVLAYGGIRWDFCQIQLNYQDWRHAVQPRNVDAEYLYAQLERAGVPAVIMEPLLGGRLARVPAQALEILKRANPTDTAATWAFRYAGTPPGVLCVLSGMVYMEHLQENIRAYAPLRPVDDSECAVLEQVTEILVDSDYIQCTQCEYCMPCPYGIDIPGVFAHYNRCVSAGRILSDGEITAPARDGFHPAAGGGGVMSTDVQSVDSREYREARRAFLVGYDRSVPRLRQAAHCIECRQCIPKCPQSIPIVDEMRRVDQYAERLRTMISD